MPNAWKSWTVCWRRWEWRWEWRWEGQEGSRNPECIPEIPSGFWTLGAIPSRFLISRQRFCNEGGLSRGLWGLCFYAWWEPLWANQYRGMTDGFELCWIAWRKTQSRRFDVFSGKKNMWMPWFPIDSPLKTTPVRYGEFCGFTMISSTVTKYLLSGLFMYILV